MAYRFPAQNAVFKSSCRSPYNPRPGYKKTALHNGKENGDYYDGLTVIQGLGFRVHGLYRDPRNQLVSTLEEIRVYVRYIGFVTNYTNITLRFRGGTPDHHCKKQKHTVGNYSEFYINRNCA